MQTQTAPQAPNTPKKKKGGSSRAVINREVALTSHQAQQAYKRSYIKVSRDLYVLSVVLRTLTSDDVAQEVEQMVDNIFTDIRGRFTNEVERLKAQCDDAGVTPTPDFTAPEHVTAEIATPLAGQYLGLIQMLDEVIGLMSALWLAGMKPSSQHSAECYQWQQNLIKSGNRVQEITRRAVNAANREKEEAEADKLARKGKKAAKEGDKTAAETSSEVEPTKVDAEISPEEQSDPDKKDSAAKVTSATAKKAPVKKKVTKKKAPAKKSAATGTEEEETKANAA